MGFNKSPGAYVDVQYPEDIADQLNVTTADMMNIYALHRMRNMEPNYIQMKIKNVSVASFYSGFSFKHYVGRPDYAITVFLSDDDVLPNEFEGMLRRLAHYLLPKRTDLEFDIMFQEEYDDLQIYEVEPFWQEILEGEGSKISTIQADDLDDEQSGVPEAPQIEELNFDDQFDKFEKDELKDQIKELQEMVRERQEKIRDLTDKITGQASPENAAEVQILKQQLDEQNVKLDDWSFKLADLAEKNAILMETVRKLTEMSMQQTEEMERQGRKLIEQNKIIDEKDAAINELMEGMPSEGASADTSESSIDIDKLKESNEVLSNKIKQLEEEKESHIDTITNLKLEIKQIKDQVSDKGTSDVSAQNEFQDQLIELKKDLKIIRRERDHYKNIVKEKDLLK